MKKATIDFAGATRASKMDETDDGLFFQTEAEEAWAFSLRLFHPPLDLMLPLTPETCLT